MSAAGLALFAARATVLLALALALDLALRKAPALHRHRMWTLTFAALLLLPVLPYALPALPITVPAAWGVEAGMDVPMRAREAGADPRSTDRTASAGRLPGVESTDRDAEVGGDPRGAATPPARVDRLRGALTRAADIPARALLFFGWIAGVALAAGALLCAHHRARRVVRGARDLVRPEWTTLLDDLRGRLGLRRRVALRTTSHVRTPMAGGLLAALVLLPDTAGHWSATRRRVVLSHELVHHAHHDPLRHLLARAALALLWFHPLAWLAARQAVLAREQACDERVVTLGTRPSDYARHLLELAESLTLPAPAPLAALPMIQRSLLEKRLMSILTARHARRSAPLAVTGAVALVLVTLTIAAAAPTAPATAQEPIGPIVPIPETELIEPEALISSTELVVPTEVTTPLAASPSSPSAQLPESACAWPDHRDSFSGTLSINSDRPREDRYQRFGWSDGWRVLQTTEDGLRICAQSSDGERYDDRSWSEVVADGGRVMLEIRDDDAVQAMEIEGGEIVDWRVDGASRSVDETARRWRQTTLAVADGLWEATRIRGQVSSLRGEISSIHGQRSSLRGQISSLRGQVSSMRGQISSARGNESSLRGRISSLRGHVSSLRGAISSERGAISSVRSYLRHAEPDERERLEARIARHEQRIEELEQEIQEFDLEGKVAQVERLIDDEGTDAEVARIEQQIEDFDLEAKVAEVEEQLSGLDVEGRVEEIERRIEALDADRRVEEARRRVDQHLAELQRLVSSLR